MCFSFAHSICWASFYSKQSWHSIISSVFLTDFELPPRSSHFDSGPKDGKKQTTNQVDGLERTSSWTLNRLAATKLYKRSFFNYRCEKYDTDVKCM